MSDKKFISLSSSGSIYFPETGFAPSLFLSWLSEHSKKISDLEIRLVYQDNIDDPNCFFVSFNSASKDLSQAQLYNHCLTWLKNNV